MTHPTRGALAEWPALKSKLSDYAAIYQGAVPSLAEVNTIPDAPICGGGTLTVAVDGDQRQLNYRLSKSDFWAIVLRPDMLFQKHHIRQAPLGRLALTIHNAAEEAGSCRHTQDMASAEIRSQLPFANGSLHVRCVAAAQQDYLVYEFEATGSTASLTAAFLTENEHDNFFILEGNEGQETAWLRKEHTSFVTVNAAVAMRTLGGQNVRTVYDHGQKAALSFDVQPGAPVHLLLSVKGGKDQYRCLDRSIAALDATGPAEVDRLLADHATWWRNFWLRSWLELGDPLLERFYYGAQYVHGCSINLAGRVVPGLAGGWITSPNPIWGGSYTMNYNGESPFWGLCSSNRGDWLLPYARVCLDYIPKGRKLARRLDTQGIVMPVMIGPWGIADNDDALGQKSNASMAALALIWHWETTRDQTFLADVLYPYLRELTDFWEDNLELDRSGRYVIHGSARERNHGDINPSEDLAFVRRVLETALDASNVLQRDADRRDQWSDYLANLSEHPVMAVAGNLCFKEAENRIGVSTQGVGDNVCALNAVYPGGALDGQQAEAGRLVARNTLRYLQSWNQENSFTRVFSQAVRAEFPGDELLARFTQRLREPGEGLHEHLRRNNTFLPGDHSFEGTAGTECLNSMLAQAHGGILKVFHVWPRDRDAAFHRIRVRGAFLISGTLSSGHVTHLEIHSEQGGTCRMQSCWPGQGIAVTDLLEDEERLIMPRQNGDIWEWDTAPGTTYCVAAGPAVTESEPAPPLLLTPVIAPEVQADDRHTGGDLDILLTPQHATTQLAFHVVLADESRRDCTGVCQFSVADTSIAHVDADHVLSARARGRTTVNVLAEIEGVRLVCSVSLYVLADDVIFDLVATASSPSGAGQWNSLCTFVKGYGMDGPDVSALARANSYGFGTFQVDPSGSEPWICFDLGTIEALDEMWVWNYNAPDDYRVLWWQGGTRCGLRDITLAYSQDGQTWCELRTEGHPYRLAPATGKQRMPATNLADGTHRPIRFHGVRARFVRITPDPEIGTGNWGGDRFGLSQVRFTRQSPLQ